MSPRLAINIATRGRPDLLVDTIKKTRANISLSDTQIMISIDSDDLAISSKVLQAVGGDVMWDTRPREDTVAAKWNRAIGSFPEATVHMPMTDDSPILTRGFDRLIIEAAERLPDNIGMIYGPLVNASFPALICMTGGLIDKLGYIYPEYFPYWFVDHWTDDVVRMIDRISFADVEIEQAQNIGVTTERREPTFWATFFDMCRLMRRREARAIIDSPDFLETPGRKEMLRAHHPLIEFRSMWINDHVRHSDALGQLPKESPHTGGDRYARLKGVAMSMADGMLYELDRTPGCERIVAIARAVGI